MGAPKCANCGTIPHLLVEHIQYYRAPNLVSYRFLRQETKQCPETLPFWHRHTNQHYVNMHRVRLDHTPDNRIAPRRRCAINDEFNSSHSKLFETSRASTSSAVPAILKIELWEKRNQSMLRPRFLHPIRFLQMRHWLLR